MTKSFQKKIDKVKLFAYLYYLGIEAILRVYSARVKNSGKNTLQFICPFHDDERLGSTIAYLGKNDFVCYACGVGGSLEKLVLQYASILHGIPLSDFNALLEAIVIDLGIPRESVVSDGDWNGSTVKRETVDENLYISLFGAPYFIIEKNFTVVPLPNGGALRVPTEVEKVYYKTLLIKDRNNHDEVIRQKARSVFREQVQHMTYADAEALMKKQLPLLQQIIKTRFDEEVTYRKNFLARKMLIDAYLQKKSGRA